MHPENSEECRPCWIGIDVSKVTFDAAVHPAWDPKAKVPLSSLPKQSFSRTRAGVDELLAWLDGVHPEAEARVVMEVTGRYSLELAGWLTEARPSLVPVIADPKAVCHFIRSLRLRNKTDRADAAAIARFGAERSPVAPAPTAPEYVKLRELSRERGFIAEAITAAGNRNTEIGQCREVASVHKKVMRELEKCRIQIESLMREHIESHSNLQQAVRRLDTIPGVAFLTAATILAELGDLTRFRKSRSLSAFAGTSPRRHESGKSVRGKTRMCKQGGPRARQALYLASLAAIRCRKDNELSRFYADLVANGKPKMSAIGAVMRKMLVLMRAVLINEADYDDNWGQKECKPAA